MTVNLSQDATPGGWDTVGHSGDPLSRRSWTEATVAGRADVHVTALGLPSAPILKNKILPFLRDLEGRGPSRRPGVHGLPERRAGPCRLSADVQRASIEAHVSEGSQEHGWAASNAPPWISGRGRATAPCPESCSLPIASDHSAHSNPQMDADEGFGLVCL